MGLFGVDEPPARRTIGPPFFNHYMVPVGLALLALMGIGPLVAWRKTSERQLVTQFVGPLSAGIVAVLLAVALAPSGPANGWALACFGLCGFTFWTIVQEFYRGVQVRRKNRPQPVLEALITLVVKARRRYGGYIVHLGVVLMFFGWGGNAYKIERKVPIRPGETVELGQFEIRHDGVLATQDWQKEMITVDFAVLEDGEQLDTLRPAKWWYYQLPDQPTTEVSRYMTAAGDVYISIDDVQMTDGWVRANLFWNPLVNWVWAGFAVLLAGGVICIGTRKEQ
jgi:cytochrome c-type biogenesis protein CcmF